MRCSVGAAVAILLVCASLSARAESPPDAESTAPWARAESARHAEATEAPGPPASARYGIVAVGVGVTALFYGAAAGVSFAYPDAPGARDLRVPIVGPWMAIANNGCGGDPDCSDVLVALRSIVMAIDGLAQAAGPLVVLEGLLLRSGERQPRLAPPLVLPPPRSVPQPSPESPREAPPGGGRNLFYLPTPAPIGATGVGVRFSGTF